jgi:hypothetical protein
VVVADFPKGSGKGEGKEKENGQAERPRTSSTKEERQVVDEGRRRRSELSLRT